MRTSRLGIVAGIAVLVSVVTMLGVVPADAATPFTVPPTGSPAFAAPWAPNVRETNAPDPAVLRVGSTYYAYTTGTTWGNHIGVLTSSSPASGWRTISGGRFGSSAFPSVHHTQPVRPWQVAGTTNAPGVFRIGGKYVMYYTAQAASGHGGHYCLSVATASSPRGPFADTSGAPWLCDDAHGGVVDPSPIVDSQGRAWLVYKTYDDVETSGQPSLVYVVRLSANGLQRTGAPVVVINQRNVSSPFETVENPQLFQNGATYFLLYSRGDWDGANAPYRQGVATCSGPQGPCHETDPNILSTYGGVNSPGGGTMFRDAAGRWYLGYAGWNAPCTRQSSDGCARRFYVARVTIGIQVPCRAATPVRGYRFAASDGGVFVFGNQQFCGSTGALSLSQPIVGMATTRNGGGYWLVAADGGIFSFGNARFFGSTGAIRLQQPIVGMTPAPDGRGYWLVARDGGIFNFGSARFYGSTGALRLNQPIVGMAAAPDGRGYWLVARDGGIFSFGSARFHGSTGAIRLRQPVVGMASTRSGNGYWFVAADGGIFAFGDARFHGSTGALRLSQPIVGMARTRSGNGYWLVARDGGIFNFGDAKFYGSTGAIRLTRPIIGMG